VAAAVAPPVVEDDRVLEAPHAGPRERVASALEPRGDVGPATEEGEHLRHERQPAAAGVLVQRREDLSRRTQLNEIASPHRAPDRDCSSGVTPRASGKAAGVTVVGLVSVLVVTHRDLALLDRALGAVAGSSDVELVIVNNDPSQDVRAWAGARVPRARVIDMGFDAGFPRGMNEGIAASRGEFVLLLDSDLFLSPSYVAELRAFLAANAGVGAAGGKLLRYDLQADRETDVIDSAGVRLARNRRVMARGEGEHDRGQYDRAEQLFGVDGAGMFLRRSALESVAVDGEYFDSSFFMHKEDTDLCWRLRLAGWEIWYVPSAVAAHGRTTRGLGTRGYLTNLSAVRRNERVKRSPVRLHAMKNQWLMLTKNEDARNLLRDLPFILGRECGVLLYNAVFAPRALAAVPEYLRLLPAALGKRRLMRRRCVLRPAQMRTWLR
jgi:GT2 family glycosyltransferase